MSPSYCSYSLRQHTCWVLRPLSEVLSKSKDTCSGCFLNVCWKKQSNYRLTSIRDFHTSAVKQLAQRTIAIFKRSKFLYIAAFYQIVFVPDIVIFQANCSLTASPHRDQHSHITSMVNTPLSNARNSAHQHLMRSKFTRNKSTTVHNNLAVSNISAFSRCV